jgi:hypothetical protein
MTAADVILGSGHMRRMGTILRAEKIAREATEAMLNFEQAADVHERWQSLFFRLFLPA